MSGDKQQKVRDPPPFFMKTLEMVEDPNTDEIISWSDDKQSLIIWDQHKFSSLLLPQNFRHDNFSSFIYQLNNYGFKKINLDRWEYANKSFQDGNKHLLCNIKSRSQLSRNLGRHGQNFQSMKAEFEKLKEEQNQPIIQIHELMRKQQSIENQFANTKFTKEEEEEMLKCLVVKAFENPSFIEQVIHHIIGNKGEESNGHVTKKPRLNVEANSPRGSVEALNSTNDADATIGGDKSWEEEPKTKNLGMPDPSLNSESYVWQEQKLVDDAWMNENETQGKVR